MMLGKGVVPVRLHGWISEYLDRVAYWSTQTRALVLFCTLLIASLSAYMGLLHKTLAEDFLLKPVSELQRDAQHLAEEVKENVVSAEQLAREVDAYHNQLIEVPPDRHAGQTLEFLGALSDELELIVKRIRPVEVAMSNRHRSVSKEQSSSGSVLFVTRMFDLTVQGEYAQFLKFLQQIRQSRWVAVIEEMDIAADEKTLELQARFRLKFYFTNTHHLMGQQQ